MTQNGQRKCRNAKHQYADLEMLNRAQNQTREAEKDTQIEQSDKKIDGGPS
jgi:hypothetical protein